MSAAGTCRKCSAQVAPGSLRCPTCGKLFPLGPPPLAHSGASSGARTGTPWALEEDEAPTNPRAVRLDDSYPPELESGPAPAPEPGLPDPYPEGAAVEEPRTATSAQDAVGRAIAEGLLGLGGEAPLDLARRHAPVEPRSGPPAALAGAASLDSLTDAPPRGDYALVDLVAGIFEPKDATYAEDPEPGAEAFSPSRGSADTAGQVDTPLGTGDPSQSGPPDDLDRLPTPLREADGAPGSSLAAPEAQAAAADPSLDARLASGSLERHGSAAALDLSSLPLDPSPPALDLSSLDLDPPPSVLEPSPPTLDLSSLPLDPSPPALDLSSLDLDPPPPLEPSPPPLEPPRSVLEPSPPTLEPSPPTLEPSPPTLEPSPPTLDLSSPAFEASSVTHDADPPETQPSASAQDPSVSAEESSPPALDLSDLGLDSGPLDLAGLDLGPEPLSASLASGAQDHPTAPNGVGDPAQPPEGSVLEVPAAGGGLSDDDGALVAQPPDSAPDPAPVEALSVGAVVPGAGLSPPESLFPDPLAPAGPDATAPSDSEESALADSGAGQDREEEQSDGGVFFAATVLDAHATQRASDSPYEGAPGASEGAMEHADRLAASLSPAARWPDPDGATPLPELTLEGSPSDEADEAPPPLPDEADEAPPLPDEAVLHAGPPAVIAAGRWDTAAAPAAHPSVPRLPTGRAVTSGPPGNAGPAILAHGPAVPQRYDPHEEQATHLIFAPRANTGAGPPVIAEGPLALPPPSALVAGAQTMVLDTKRKPLGGAPAALSVSTQPSSGSPQNGPLSAPWLDLPRGATPPPPPVPGVSDDPLVGELIDGKYQVLRRLGVGGMGAVYLAEQVDMRRRVALKVLSSQGGVNRAEHERRFQREAQAASKLNHPNIVTVYTFGRLPDSTLFLAMEYIEGVELSDLMRQEGSLAVVRALEIAIQVCAGLGEAHSHGVVHRDLKPDNIIVTRRRGEETAKILDFGIAKILDPNEAPADVTRVGLVRGTPIYMSPEQARGDRIDHRSDIYSLGVILHFLLTGQHPVQADTPFGYLHAHQHQKPPGIRAVRPELSFSVALEGLILRCLEKRPEQRPASVSDLEDGLKLVRADLLGVTPDPAWRALPQAVRPRGHARWILPVIAVVMLALMGTLLVRVINGPPDEHPPPGARTAPGPEDAAVARPAPASAPAPVAPKRVEASPTGRPEWVGEAPVQVGDERVAVGLSGPTATRREATRWARAAAGDALAQLLMDDLGQPDLLLTLRGLAGDRRAVLRSGFRPLMERVMAEGVVELDEALLSELRSGEQDVSNRLDQRLEALGLRQGLPKAEVYWERYREGTADDGTEFFRAWARRTLPAAPVHRVLQSAKASRQVVGVTVVDPYPSISWGLRDPQGALVYAVKQGEPGAKAGLLPGDLVVAVANRPVQGREDLFKLLPPLVSAARRSGEGVNLSVRRAGEGRFEVELRFPKPRRARPTAPASTSGGSIDE